MVFHCVHRGNDRREIFDDAADYAAFERVMEQIVEAVPMGVLADCLMRNHFHLLLWPRADGQLAASMQRLQEKVVWVLSEAWAAVQAGAGAGKDSCLSVNFFLDTITNYTLTYVSGRQADEPAIDNGS
jgi:putative transposase